MFRFPIDEDESSIAVTRKMFRFRNLVARPDYVAYQNQTIEMTIKAVDHIGNNGPTDFDQVAAELNLLVFIHSHQPIVKFRKAAIRIVDPDMAEWSFRFESRTQSFSKQALNLFRTPITCVMPVHALVLLSEITTNRDGAPSRVKPPSLMRNVLSEEKNAFYRSNFSK